MALRRRDEVTASNLLLLDESGAVLEGEGEIDATAFFIHKVGGGGKGGHAIRRRPARV